MQYKTKVTVVTKGKEYRPGTILPGDISAGDLAFLRERKFVEPVDIPMEYDEQGMDGEEGDFSAFNEREPEALKTVEEIEKIRSKKEVIRYAESIGLELEDSKEKSLKELQDEVINFQEEKMGEEHWDDTGEE